MPAHSHNIGFLFYSPFICTIQMDKRKEGLDTILGAARKEVHRLHEKYRRKKKINLEQLLNPSTNTFEFKNIMLSPLSYKEFVNIKKGYLRNPLRPTQGLSKYVELANEVVSAFNWDSEKAGLVIEHDVKNMVKYLSNTKGIHVLPDPRNPVSSVVPPIVVHKRLRLNTTEDSQKIKTALSENNDVAATVLDALSLASPEEFPELAGSLDILNIRGTQLEVANKLFNGDVSRLTDAIRNKDLEFLAALNNTCSSRGIKEQAVIPKEPVLPEGKYVGLPVDEEVSVEA